MTVHHNQSKFIDRGIVYPDSDGKPMADNTLQAYWIVMLYNNLKGLFVRKHVFVAADLFWYPVKGDPNTKVAPDVLVVFGRPEGHRGSYKQWMEDDIPPQVVFEVLSPSNTHTEMIQKQRFYERHGVSEFIIIDPDTESFVAYESKKGKLMQVDEHDNPWQSHQLGIFFEKKDGKLTVSHSDGSKFQTFEEVQSDYTSVIKEKDALIKEKDSLEVEKNSLLEKNNAAEAEIRRLKERLRELGERLDE
ncbi:MAG: Uma2 family endonuclease [Bacteroidota bacterium]